MRYASGGQALLFMQGDGNEGVFKERDELLQTEEYPANAQLAKLLRESFTNICDVKQSGDNLYYRLNDEKVQCSPRLHASFP